MKFFVFFYFAVPRCSLCRACHGCVNAARRSYVSCQAVKSMPHCILLPVVRAAHIVMFVASLCAPYRFFTYLCGL